jgi:signal transduction histidine kinase
MQTIRSRLIVVFIVCLAFTSGMAAFHYYNIYILEKKIVLMEQFDDFNDQTLELRRYEKNYFLTGKTEHLEQMKYYLSIIEKSFFELEKQMKVVLNASEYDRCALSLKEYRFIIASIDRPGENRASGAQALRAKGKILTSFSEQLISQKRKRLNKVLSQMRAIPIASSAALVILVILISYTIKSDVLRPLMLLQNAAESAGKGVIKPVQPGGHKAGEVSECIAAFNNMILEINTRQEQLLQSRKMASIGTFTSGIAHELNNPINNISLIVDTLIEEGENLSAPERSELYNDLMEQAERSSEIVKNLLEFSRTDQDHFQNISMQEMVEKTKRLLKNEVKLKQVVFQTRVQENLPKVWIDQSRLQQALVNLLLNSIQAMPDGGELNLSIETVPEKEEIRIDVKDTGVGIPAERLDSIFDPFFTTKKEGEGTGLGLSVTYNIIKHHNGRIYVESAPGEGTCFSIFLPVKT